MQQLIEQLRREQFIPEEGRDEHDRGFRAGWNARAESIARQLQEEQERGEGGQP